MSIILGKKLKHVSKYKSLFPQLINHRYSEINPHLDSDCIINMIKILQMCDSL